MQANLNPSQKVLQSPQSGGRAEGFRSSANLPEIYLAEIEEDDSLPQTKTKGDYLRVCRLAEPGSLAGYWLRQKSRIVVGGEVAPALGEILLKITLKHRKHPQTYTAEPERIERQALPHLGEDP
jgi:hypothetical protein